MPKLLRNNELLTDNSWQEQSGVTLPGDSDPETLTVDFKNTALIRIEFAVFTDGRAFSLARSLRERFDYTGELRAVGNFIPDQLHYLCRCGFNSFEFADDIEESTIRECLDAFSEHYQAAVDDPQPLFRKRA